MARKGPWYTEFDEWHDEALAWLRAYHSLPAGAPQHAEVHSYSQLAAMRLVFESNAIEGAGLSEGDTRKVIQDNLPATSGAGPFWEAFKPSRNTPPSPLPLPELKEFGIKKLGFDYRFEKRTRGATEVIRHYDTYLSVVIAFGTFFERALHQSLRNPSPAALDDLAFREFAFSSIPTNPLITEDLIRSIHAEIASGLLPDDAGIEAGQYRIDARSVGLDIAFPAPELVPASMQRFVVESNATLGAPGDPFMKAARVTYDFLMIHPFPDFNGRVSRLLLALILFAAGAPFPVALRGTGDWKRRYLFALRRASRGDLRPYATLIAQRVVESFREIDLNLRRAGLEPLLPGRIGAPG